MNKKSTTLYNTRTWLNELSSPSTGSVVCYHGIQEYPDEKEPYENLFLEISDCHVKARLHKTIHESKNDFINKLKDLRGSITDFIYHLEKEL